MNEQINMRGNLEQFGIHDMEVVGVLYDKERNKVGEVSESLTQLCVLAYSGLAKHFGRDAWQVDFDIEVRVEEAIGYVCSDGIFHYLATPNLRTALAWFIATDGGREHYIDFFDVDAAANAIIDTVRTNGTSQEAFFGAYFDVLKRVFVCDKTSRFGDGYCMAATFLWWLATRELGVAHDGYSFAF